MARLISREFNPTASVYVRRFFVAAGRHWNPGDLFDWPRLSVAQRRVKQLFDAGKLMHQADVDMPAPPATRAPTIETEVQDDTILTDAAAPPADGPTPPAPPPVPSVDEPEDDLVGLNMKELREIAEREGAPSRVSRESQRDAIRETRRGKNE